MVNEALFSTDQQGDLCFLGEALGVPNLFHLLAWDGSVRCHYEGSTLYPNAADLACWLRREYEFSNKKVERALRFAQAADLERWASESRAGVECHQWSETTTLATEAWLAERKRRKLPHAAQEWRRFRASRPDLFQGASNK